MTDHTDHAANVAIEIKKVAQDSPETTQDEAFYLLCRLLAAKGSTVEDGMAYADMAAFLLEEAYKRITPSAGATDELTRLIKFAYAMVMRTLATLEEVAGVPVESGTKATVH